MRLRRKLSHTGPELLRREGCPNSVFTKKWTRSRRAELRRATAKMTKPERETVAEWIRGPGAWRLWSRDWPRMGDSL